VDKEAIGKVRVASLEVRLHDLIDQDDATLSHSLKGNLFKKDSTFHFGKLANLIGYESELATFRKDVDCINDDMEDTVKSSIVRNLRAGIKTLKDQLTAECEARREAELETKQNEWQATLHENAPIVPRAPEFGIDNIDIYRRNDRLVWLVKNSLGVNVPANGNQVVVNFKTNKMAPTDIVIEFESEEYTYLLHSQVWGSSEGGWYLHYAYSITCHKEKGQRV